MKERLSRKQTDLNLAKGLIPYLGNKRRLLPRLESVFRRYESGTGPTRFADPFAGSGAVARLACTRGYRVLAGDIEPYASILTRAHICTGPEQADSLFEDLGGLHAAIEHLNGVGCEASVAAGRTGYISRHYAPALTHAPNIGRERLFYTAENARFIDAVRDEICAIVNDAPEAQAMNMEALVLAPLLLEAAVHVNTSGVFKAYHRGFGGNGRDALKRIMAPMRLEAPSLYAGVPGTVRCCDAVSLFRDIPADADEFDIVYLDPPYNSHQYGSNYFMLNTIALWDKPQVSTSTGPDGSLSEKAGIRDDWKRTRSAFCSARSAAGALRELVREIRSKVIVLSYNTEGVIPLPQLCDIMSEHGHLSVETVDYTQYRGGRQSAGRRNHTTEILLISARESSNAVTVCGAELASVSGPDGRERIEYAVRLRAFSRSRFVPDRVLRVFGNRDAVHTVGLGRIQFRDGYRADVEATLEDLIQGSCDELQSACSALESCQCMDHVEELDVLLLFLRERTSVPGHRDRELEQRYITLLRKLAHPRYVRYFNRYYAEFVRDESRKNRNRAALKKLHVVACARMGDAITVASPGEKT